VASVASPYIAEHVEQHTAVDINSWAVSEASQFYPGISFSVASATELPFPDHSFDAVITWTVLQHIPNALVGKALSEIKRVANPKSLIILCEATLYAGKPRRAGSTHTIVSPNFMQRCFRLAASLCRSSSPHWIGSHPWALPAG
jgi:ubiquinone/menaquinone biosynthesis C-methylase UbiE